MGCANCSNSVDGKPKGCNSNGTCVTGGCNKLEVFDWLANMQLPDGQKPFDVVEIRFKNSRKSFYRNAHDLTLQNGDVVVVEGSPGHDVGVVCAAGELARLQVNKKQPNYKPHDLRKIYRKANETDIKTWQEARSREDEARIKARELAHKHQLVMKICDVEFQGDNKKATFYYTAEERVDFRQLIKDYANAFKVRIEMRQIGARQEAGRLGGIGSCGRELCCSTWLTDFRSVTTAAARYQQLSINPQKLAGQCGKLKCCLNYELDQYVEALQELPKTNIRLKTQKGEAYHLKTDIFKKLMWYMYKDSSDGNLIPLKVERVKEIIQMNKDNKKPEDLKDFAVSTKVEKTDFGNVVGQDDLTRFDDVFKKKKKKKRKKKRKPRNKQGKSNHQNSKK